MVSETSLWYLSEYILYIYREGCVWSLQYQLGILRTITAFAWRQRKTKKMC